MAAQVAILVARKLFSRLASKPGVHIKFVQASIRNVGASEKLSIDVVAICDADRWWLELNAPPTDAPPTQTRCTQCPARKKWKSRYQSTRQRSHCQRKCVTYNAPPEKSTRQRSHLHCKRVAHNALPETLKKHMLTNAVTVASRTITANVLQKCSAREKRDSAYSD